jgi:hypothetical protein
MPKKRAEQNDIIFKKNFQADKYQIFKDEWSYIKERRKAHDKKRVDNDKKPENEKQNWNDKLKKNKFAPSTGNEVVGLALSGGGIRSAIFNLGFIQSLFLHGILKQVDYLSTVSGGGYIGSCLTTLLNSTFKNVEEKEEDEENNSSENSIPWSPKYFPLINAKKNDDTGELILQKQEKGPLRHLRHFSNYLTPDEGFVQKYVRPFLIFLRGIFLNFLLIIPYILLVALLLAFVLNSNSLFPIKTSHLFFDLQEFKESLESVQSNEKNLHDFVVINGTDLTADSYEEKLSILSLLPKTKNEISNLRGSIAAAKKGLQKEWLTIWIIPGAIFGFLLILSLFLLPIRSRKFKRRALFNRICSLIFFVALVFLGVQLYGVGIVYWKNWAIPSSFGLISILSFFASKLLQNTKRKEKSKKLSSTKIVFSFVLMALVPLLFLFIIGHVVYYLSNSSQEIGQFVFNLFNVTLHSVGESVIIAVSYLSALIVVILLFVITEALINLNLISPYNFYRDRLSRAYLIQHDESIRKVKESSDQSKEAKENSINPFEEVIHRDHLKLSAIYDDPVPSKGPYHLVNTTLNLAKKMPKEGESITSRTSTSEFEELPKNGGILRTGESFVFSKYWCGSEKTGYLLTRKYENLDEHLDLGTAMAISAAAANIGMAQKNIPAVRWLMALLNIRLGYWVANPMVFGAHDKDKNRFKITSPGGVQALKEWVGRYSLKNHLINLSDGGHFDNLGVYELLRRRCKYIIVGDAEADPAMKFEALAYIIRLARIDFGIQIDIDISDMMRDEKKGYSTNHCAVGIIQYPPIDNNFNEERGYLLYCKSSLTGDEPHHLHEYKVENPTFPQQTTADQWFDEQQFEAYRELGYHVGKTVLRPIEKVEKKGLEEKFTLLKEFWHPHSEAVRKHFTRHAGELNRIIILVKNDEDLKYIDREMYPEWDELTQKEAAVRLDSDLWPPDDEKKIRKGFHICNLMMHLMENVYIDLDLETQYAHPDNRGWMNLFMHWSWAGIFRLTWSVSVCTYGARFQRFCDRHLGLDPGEDFLDDMDINMQREKSHHYDKEKFNKLLNPYERMLVTKFFERKEYAVRKIFSFRLKVKNKLNDERYKTFGFGFALTDGENRLIFFRIQDHLRKMGLSRLAMKKLIKEEKVTYDASIIIKDELETIIDGKIDLQNFERRWNSVKLMMKEELEK